MITIVLPVSRAEYLDRVLGSLELLECRAENVNIIAIVDGDDKLFVQTRNKIQDLKFNERLTVKYKNPKPVTKFDIYARRLRIADIHNHIKQYINPCEFIFGVEDDTLLPQNALQEMTTTYLDHPRAGMVQGVEMGRWGVPYVGAWKADDIYSPTVIESLDLGEGVEPVDCGGMYCFMTRYETYMAHEFKTFQKNSLGPDVEFGLELRKAGYENYVNWNVKCSHINNDKIISFKNTVPKKVIIKKHNTKWYAST